MRIYIDTNTFPASPALYADAEKTKPLPRIIPLVQGFRGEIEVCFLGELSPKPGDGLTLAMRPYGTGADVVRTETVAVVVGAEVGVAASAKVSLAVNTDALQAAIGTRETLNVLCGVIVTDDAAAFPTRMEWQIVFTVAASALPNGVPAPEISPSAVDVLRDEINAVKTDLAKNYVNRNSSQDVAGVKSFLQGINIGSSANPFGVPDWRIVSGGITYFGGGMSMPGNTKILPQGVSSDVISARALQGLGSAGEILIPAKTGTFALVSDVESAVGKALTSVYKYAGQVPTEADLPESAENGDVYDVADTGKNYAYDAKLGRWDAFGGTINYATAAELQALQSAVATKANDADVVHKDGNEAIDGDKTFVGRIVRFENIYTYINDLRAEFSVEIGGSLGGGKLSVLPLGTTTALGAPAYGLHVSATGGLQLFGTHFLNGDIWTDDSVKMVKGNVSLTSTDTASIGFDYANNVIFRTMPNDGTEATYKLEAWQWDDDSHTTKSASAGVKLLKPSQKTELEPTSVLNMQEGDARWWQAGSSNITLTPNGQSSPVIMYLDLNAGDAGDFQLCFGGFVKDGSPKPDAILSFPFTGGRVALTSDIPDTSKFLEFNTEENDYFKASKPLDIGEANIGNGVLFGYYDRYEYLFPEKSGTVALLDDVSAVDLTKGGTINGTLVIKSFSSTSLEANGEITADMGTFSSLSALNGGGVQKVITGPYAIPNVQYLMDNYSRLDNTILGSGAEGSNHTNPVGVAIGENAKATGGAENAEATAVGARASATGPCSTALGRDTTASNCMTIAIGANAKATGMQAIALGAGANATKVDSIAIGHNVDNFLSSCALVGVPGSDFGINHLCIGIINDDNPGFLFVEEDDVLGATLTGVRISKENFMAMLKQFGGEDFTATKPAEA